MLSIRLLVRVWVVVASVFWVKWVIVGWSGVLVVSSVFVVVRVGVMGALSGLGFV